MRKALLVGIDHYPQAPLSGCVEDAREVESVLAKHADGSPNFDVRLLTSGGKDYIDQACLRAALEALFDGAGELALFYFAGHGLVTGRGGYLATADARTYQEGIPMGEVLALANASQSREKVVLLDCCHSGRFGTLRQGTQDLTQLAEGMTILTASSDSEKAAEVEGAGLFTSLVVEALRGGAADMSGMISPAAVYAYVDRALGPWDQRPIFRTNVSGNTSLRKVAPPVSLEILRRIPEHFPHPLEDRPLDPSYEYTSDTAVEHNVAVFKELQKLASAGLVVPVGEEYMYWAAMHSKACRLTPIGRHYRRLAVDHRI